MMPTNKTISFRLREFKGSRLRCLMVTHRPAPTVSAFFTAITGGAAVVASEDQWAPQGFLNPDEARFAETVGYLDDAQRQSLTIWWLASPRRANTPNWDLVSTAQINGQKGLILLETKAHAGEFADDRCGSSNKDNFRRIDRALNEATAAWNSLLPGFSLTANAHYQLSNRFAFTWKLASMGIPVILVYLGFLNAAEMTGRDVFRDFAQWRECVLERSRGVIPQAAWNRSFDVGGTHLKVLLRSADVWIADSVLDVAASA
jgi:hypothetical protein